MRKSSKPWNECKDSCKGTDKLPTFEPIIGLEVHAELQTASKMFCGCAVVDLTSADPNTSVCEICSGMPGTLPVINKRAIEFAIRVALALNCEIAETSVFARKNYFYPDLPKGFQISQYEMPLASNGSLTINLGNRTKDIRIRRVHMEEDTGKLSHHEGYSLVDYNRSGVPLLEVVSEPDLHSLEEVRSYAMGLRSLLRYLEVNSGDMEKGVMRFEANVSLRPVGTESLGTRTEIKNLNSFKAMIRAITYELERQGNLLSSGKQVLQETLGWDESASTTVSQRGKEEAHDYRYFPEPDLPPLQIDQEWIEEIKVSLPELPNERRKRFIEDYELTAYTADVLTADRDTADYFESSLVAGEHLPPKEMANWLSGPLFGLINERNLSIGQLPISPEAFADLVSRIDKGEISSSSGKLVLEKMFTQGRPASKIIDELGLGQISDTDKISEIVAQAIRDNPDQLNEYLNGKHSLFDWFFGQVMRATRGRADPQVVRNVLKTHLKGVEENQRPT
jgi:aspartyl-tRNA(Asn)/glutamyl-tRNA(Gln) amidotransferase subunit B